METLCDIHACDRLYNPRVRERNCDTTSYLNEEPIYFYPSSPDSFIYRPEVDALAAQRTM
jgi:hypothetical protein